MKQLLSKRGSAVSVAAAAAVAVAVAVTMRVIAGGGTGEAGAAIAIPALLGLIALSLVATLAVAGSLVATVVARVRSRSE